MQARFGTSGPELRPCTGVVEGLKATAVAAGRCTSLAVGLEGEVFSWGCSRLGRPGSGEVPGQVQGFGRLQPHRRAVGLAAGEYSTAVVTEAGEVCLGTGWIGGGFWAGALLWGVWHLVGS